MTYADGAGELTAKLLKLGLTNELVSLPAMLQFSPEPMPLLLR